MRAIFEGQKLTQINLKSHIYSTAGPQSVKYINYLDIIV